VPLVAVAIDKDKSSQNALKWDLDNVVTSKGESITLVHVNTHKGALSKFNLMEKCVCVCVCLCLCVYRLMYT
jgi:hypothetical protein